MLPNSIVVRVAPDPDSDDTRFYVINGTAEFEMLQIKGTLKPGQTWEERESAILAGIMAMVGAEDVRELALTYESSINPYRELSEPNRQR